MFPSVCQHSLPLGSQIIVVPVNSSLSWHINKLRETGKEAYNVSYAWKMVSERTSRCLSSRGYRNSRDLGSDKVTSFKVVGGKEEILQMFYNYFPFFNL